MAITVNGDEIPEAAIEHEFDRLVKFYSQHMPPSRIREQIKEIRKKAVEQAIGAKLLLEEVDRLDIQVPPADIDTKLKEMALNTGGMETLEKMLSDQDMTIDMLRETIAKGRRVDILVDKITEGMPDATRGAMGVSGMRFFIATKGFRGFWRKRLDVWLALGDRLVT